MGGTVRHDPSPTVRRALPHPEDARRSGREVRRLRRTLKNFESSNSDPKLSTLHMFRGALAAAGVISIDADDKDGPGVRLGGVKGEAVKEGKRQ